MTDAGEFIALRVWQRVRRMRYDNPPTIKAEGSYRIELRRVYGSPGFKPAHWFNLIGWDAGEESLRVFWIPQGSLQRWDVASGRRLGAVRIGDVNAYEAARVGDTHLILTRLVGYRVDETVLWDIAEATAVAPLPSRGQGGHDIFVSEDGRFALFGDGETATVCSLPGGEVVATAPGVPRAISADGSRFLVLDQKMPRSLSLRGADGRQLAVLPLDIGYEAAAAAAFDADGVVFVGRSDGLVLAWVPELARTRGSAKPRWSVKAHRGAVAALALSPDGATIYSLGIDDRLCATGADGRPLWCAVLRRPQWTRHAIRVGDWRVVPSPSGALVATGAPSTGLRVFDAVTGAERSIIEGHAGEVTCLAVSPDGRQVASGSADGDVRVNDVETGETLWVLEVDSEGVSSVEFLPDRPALRTRGYDGVLRVWSLTSGFEEGNRKTGKTYENARTYGSPNGSSVLILRGRQVLFYRDLSTAVVWSRKIAEVSDGRGVVLIEGAAFSTDGSTVLIALRLIDGPGGTESWQLMALDVATGHAVGEPHAAPGRVFALVETDDGPVSMAVVGDGLVLTEEWGSRRSRTEPLLDSQCTLARLSADRRRLVAAGPAHIDVRDLSLPASSFVGRVDLAPIDDGVTTLAISPRGDTVAVGTRSGCVLTFAIGVP